MRTRERCNHKMVNKQKEREGPNMVMLYGGQQKTATVATIYPCISYVAWV